MKQPPSSVIVATSTRGIVSVVVSGGDIDEVVEAVEPVLVTLKDSDDEQAERIRKRTPARAIGDLMMMRR